MTLDPAPKPITIGFIGGGEEIVAVSGGPKRRAGDVDIIDIVSVINGKGAGIIIALASTVVALDLCQRAIIVIFDSGVVVVLVNYLVWGRSASHGPPG